MKKPVAPLAGIAIQSPEAMPVRGGEDLTGDPPARAGRVALTLRIEPELHRKLRARAYRTDCTIQDIILEALERMGV
jgi:hypothetical protein